MKTKIGTILFALVFAIGFGFGGWFSISSLMGQLNGWWLARDWQQVSATVTEAKLETSRGKTTTYRAVARYEYEFGGKRYTGRRVGFGSGSDNVGDWQHKQYERLDAAQQSGQPVTAWVDPQRPEAAVLERSIRWSMLVFYVPFAILFPLVSLGAWWVILRTLLTPSAKLEEMPALEKNEMEIKSDAKSGLRGILFFAVFWNLISFPIAFVAISSETGPSWVWLFVSLFPLIGIGLIALVISKLRQYMQHGEVSIRLNPAQPQLGRALGVRVTFQKAPPIGEYAITLLCEHVDKRGEDTRYNTVWRQARILTVNQATNHANAGVSTSFLTTRDSPASTPEAQQYYRWRVLLIFPDGKDERAFDIVIANAAPGFIDDQIDMVAKNDATLIETHAEDVVTLYATKSASASPIPTHIAEVVDTPHLLHIMFGKTNMRLTAIFCFVFGGIFAFIGSFWLFGLGIIFVGIGVAVFGYGLFAFTHQRDVRIADGRVTIQNRSLFGANEEICATHDVQKLNTRITGTTTIGSRRYDHYEISAMLRDGRSIKLASDIRNANIAEAVLQLFQQRLVINDHAVASIERAGMATKR
jgi:MFS family permease